MFHLSRVGVNANQLHKWIQLRERANADAATASVEPLPSAFVPVVTVGEVAPVRMNALWEALKRSDLETHPGPQAVASMESALFQGRLPHNLRLSYLRSRVAASCVRLGGRRTLSNRGVDAAALQDAAQTERIVDCRVDVPGRQRVAYPVQLHPISLRDERPFLFSTVPEALQIELSIVDR